MDRVFIGFGSNQGEPLQTCLAAIGRLGDNTRIRVLRISPLYRTAPLMVTEQPWFINGVVLCETDLIPEDLLDLLHRIESDFGRTRQIRWGPRTLDLDLLAFGDRQISLPSITIPHPRLHQRRFVLKPLLDIDPEWMHPVLKVSGRELLKRIEDDTTEQKLERLETS